MPATQRCSKCGEVKPLTNEFFRVKMRNRTGLSGNCLTCEPEPGKPPAPEQVRSDAWAMCGKKKSYKSRSAAVNVILTKMRRRPDAAPLRVYECPVCLRWHLTSKPERKASE